MKWNNNRFFDILSAIGWTSVCILFLMGTSAAIDAKAQHTISRVEYHLVHLTDGNDLITVEEIKAKVLNTFRLDLVGVEVDLLDLEGLENVLEQEAFIVDTDAYIDSRDVLHVDIDQRTPILRVMGLDGSNYYLDAEGIKLPLSQHFTARVPVVSGAVTEFYPDFLTGKNSLRSAYNLVKSARKDELLNAWLEGIYVHNDGDLWLSGNLGDFKVIFGDDANIDGKVKKLKTFFKDGLKVTGWKNLDHINLKYDRQVITKSQTKV
jgi:cell division protein FtsQ